MLADCDIAKQTTFIQLSAHDKDKVCVNEVCVC